MSAVAIEVLDLLSRRIIDVDEAVRLLKAAGKSQLSRLVYRPDPGVSAEIEAIMENAGAGIRPQFGYGNIIMR